MTQTTRIFSIGGGFNPIATYWYWSNCIISPNRAGHKIMFETTTYMMFVFGGHSTWKPSSQKGHESKNCQVFRCFQSGSNDPMSIFRRVMLVSATLLLLLPLHASCTYWSQGPVSIKRKRQERWGDGGTLPVINGLQRYWLAKKRSHKGL